MNESPFNDDKFLREVDRLLESGKPSRHAGVNRLAKTRPQMDRSFQDSLEDSLIAQLQSQSSTQEKKPMHMVITPRPTHPFSFSVLTFAATIVLIMLAGKLLVDFNQRMVPVMGTSLIVTQIDDTVNIVIATQNIAAGTTITAEMVGLISLSSADMAEIRITQPNREFFADSEAVVGQMAAVDIFTFAPIDELSLGEPVDVCDLPTAPCPELPEGYFAINFPGTSDIVGGLTIGDRIDLLGMVDGKLKVIVENILLADIQPDTVVLASPSWQLGILAWYWQQSEPYALRLHIAESPEVTNTALTEYTFTAPEALPDDYKFDLIIALPVSKGYLLTGLRYSIDGIAYTQRDDLIQFWFKDLEVVSIEDGTEVTIRLPEGDAINLDYLIELRASMTFVPDEDR
jgi:flagella basal body P-ring formation protein FlgA